MKRDERIDDYIAEAPAFAQPLLIRLRAIVHAALPDVEETIKWQMPHFMVAGKNIAAMAAFKAHAAFVIHGEGRQGGAMGQFGKLTCLDDLPAEADLAARLQSMRDAVAAGKPARTRATKAKAEIPLPDDLVNALASHARAQATWTAFAPSHRREYLEWITEAKQPATRAKRLAQTLEWLAEGKRRNWKYEKS